MRNEKNDEDPFAEASQAVDALYNIRDTYFPTNPDDKTSKLVIQSNLALEVFGKIPQEKRDMPGERVTYEYLRGKLLDVFPEYKKEAEYHLSKAKNDEDHFVELLENFVELLEILYIDFVGASIVPVLGDSMEVFTEDGKKYDTLSSKSKRKNER